MKGFFSLFTPHSKSVFKQAQSVDGYLHRQTINNAILADDDRILNDETMATAHTVTSFLAQPDVPRNLTIVCSTAATGDVVITGTNIRDEVITETIAANGNTPVAGTKAFKTVTSIAIPIDADATISVGVGDVLGLERCMVSNEVILVSFDGAYETTRPTVTYDADEVEKNTIDINGTLNGAKDIVAVYVTTELY